MRKTLAAALFFALCAAVPAMAGTITSLNPSSFQVNSGEHFITVYGTGLGNRLIFDGPAGHFERDVSASFNDRVVGWVPEQVIASAGTWTLNVSGPFGNSGPATFTVKSFRLPLVLLMPEYVRVQPRDRTGAGVKYEVMAMGGADSSPVVSCDPPTGSWFPMGITHVKCVASNSLGERTTGSFPVIVRDEAPPVLSLPLEQISVRASSIEGAVVDYKVSATDAIYGEVAVDCLPRSGSVFPIGITNVLCTATDYDLNAANGSFAVEVLGDRKPYPLTVQVPMNIYVDALSPKGTEVKFDVRVTGTDDRAPRVTCSHQSGETFPIGATTVTCDALDAWGMRGSGSFEVHVADIGYPQILELYAKPDTLIADNNLYPVDIYVRAVDDVDLEPVCQIYDVTSKEDIHMKDGDDPKSYDWHVVAPLSLELRAERQTTQRTYTIWIACSDYWGNVSRTRTSVIVTGGTQSQMTAPLGGKRRSSR